MSFRLSQLRHAGSTLLQTVGLRTASRRYCGGALILVFAAMALLTVAPQAQASDCAPISDSMAFCAGNSGWQALNPGAPVVLFSSDNDVDLMVGFYPVVPKFSGTPAAFFEKTTKERAQTRQDATGTPLRGYQRDKVATPLGNVPREIYTKMRLGLTTFATSYVLLSDTAYVTLTTSQKGEAFTPAHEAAHKEALARLKRK